MFKSWQNAMDHAREMFEEDVKNLHWMTSTVEFSNAAATGEPFQAKGNPNAHANVKSGRRGIKMLGVCTTTVKPTQLHLQL